MDKPTMKDVARYAGVSVATVSHVINNSRFVAPATKEKVLKGIAELNYSLDLSAKSLKTGRKYLIAFLVPDISNPFFSTLSEEIESHLMPSQYRLLLANTKENPEKELAHLAALTPLVDGFILASTLPSSAKIKRIVGTRKPVVLLDRRLQDAPWDCVSSNSYHAVQEGTSYLLQHGHKRIGYIADLPHLSTTKERTQAYIDCMKDSGYFDETLLISARSFARKNHLHVRTLLQRGVSAIILSNQLMAIEAYIELNEQRLKGVTGIELLGFEDSNQPQYGLRHMHKIVQPTQTLARSAAERILKRIEGEEAEPRNFVFPSKLLIANNN